MRRGAALQLASGVAVLGLLAVVGYGATVQFAFAGVCANERVWSSVSPDKRYVAEVRNRDCGATTAGAMAVTLAERRAFARADTLVTYESLAAPEVRWAGANALRIRPEPGVEAFGPRPAKWRESVVYER